jgi:hypothetical protein
MMGSRHIFKISQRKSDRFHGLTKEKTDENNRAFLQSHFPRHQVAESGDLWRLLVTGESWQALRAGDAAVPAVR